MALDHQPEDSRPGPCTQLARSPGAAWLKKSMLCRHKNSLIPSTAFPIGHKRLLKCLYQRSHHTCSRSPRLQVTPPSTLQFWVTAYHCEGTCLPFVAASRLICTADIVRNFRRSSCCEEALHESTSPQPPFAGCPLLPKLAAARLNSCSTCPRAAFFHQGLCT